MIDLYDMLFDPSYEGNLNVHAFKAAIIEYMEGNVTASQIKTVFNMDVSAGTQLDIVLATVDGLVGATAKFRFILGIDSANTLAEQGLMYTSKAAYAARLGL